MRELFEPGRLLVAAMAVFGAMMIASSVAGFYVLPPLILGWLGFTAYQSSVRKRFLVPVLRRR